MPEPQDPSAPGSSPPRPTQSSLPQALKPESLKQSVVKGGLYLTLRQMVSVGLSILSILVIARELGPTNYGILVNALGIYNFITWTGKLGLQVYLIQQKDLPGDAAAQVLAFFNGLSVLFATSLWLLAPLIWPGEPVADLVRWLPLPIATEMAASVSIAMLERQLAFAEVGLIEILAQIANYAIALPLVLIGWRYWGPIVGLGLRGVVMLAMAQYLYPIRWQWRWRWAFLRPALRYGLAFSLSYWVISLRALTLPVIVTPLAGFEIAGLVSIAIRLAEQLSTLRMVIRRMSISVMAKLTDNAAAVRGAISRGMAYQALAIGAVCSAFACLDSWVIPLLFGDKWIQSTHIFPLVALSVMVRAMFDLHAGALYALDRNGEVTKSYLIYMLLLWGGAALLMPLFQSWGYSPLWGYGWAEVLTIFSSFWLHHALASLYGRPQYGAALWLTLAAMVPIVGSLVSPLAGIVTFALSYSLVLLIPAVRLIPLELIQAVRSRRPSAPL